MTTICVDVMGADKEPAVLLEGVAQALEDDFDLEVLVAGDASADRGPCVRDRVPEHGVLRHIEGDVRAGFDLTGHFLEQFVFHPQNKPLPPARVWMLDKLGDAGRL